MSRTASVSHPEASLNFRASLPTSIPASTAPRPPTPILNHAHLPSSPKSPTLEPGLASLSLHNSDIGLSYQEPERGRVGSSDLGGPNGVGYSTAEKGKGKARAEDASARPGPAAETDELYYRQYRSEEEDLAGLMRLVEEELSEPYNIYTFRYFLIDWPHLAFLVYPSSKHKIPIGTIVCKQDQHRNRTNRGYIAMLSVDRKWRRRGIGENTLPLPDRMLPHLVKEADQLASTLIKLAIDEMIRRGAHEIVLETECDNSTSLALYESLGFMREKALQRFYSNGKDAYRLLLPLPNHPYLQEESAEEAENARWEVGQGPSWLQDLDEEEAYERGMGGPDIGNCGGAEIMRAGTPRPRPSGGGGDGRGGQEWRPDLPPRPDEWDGMYT